MWGQFPARSAADNRGSEEGDVPSTSVPRRAQQGRGVRSRIVIPRVARSLAAGTPGCSCNRPRARANSHRGHGVPHPDEQIAHPSITPRAEESRADQRRRQALAVSVRRVARGAFPLELDLAGAGLGLGEAGTGGGRLRRAGRYGQDQETGAGKRGQTHGQPDRRSDDRRRCRGSQRPMIAVWLAAAALGLYALHRLAARGRTPRCTEIGDAPAE